MSVVPQEPLGLDTRSFFEKMAKRLKQAAVLGMKKVDEAMKSVENRVKPLLP